MTIITDTSGSMSGNNRLEEARQAAKLACLILDGRVQLIGFSHTTDVSAVFDLKTQRAEALGWLDRLQATGGTQYTPALDAAAANSPRCIVFLSDGEPSEKPQEVLDLIARKIRCPLHTLAVETTPEARTLLGKMAAATSGGMHAIDQPAQIVDVFLSVLGQLRAFARLEVTAERHELRDVSGDVLAIGFGCTPDLGGKEPPTSVSLSGTRVTLARAAVAGRGTVTATTKRGPNARMILLRFDQAVATMTLGPPTFRDGKGHVRAEVQFRDAAGKPLDPRKPDSQLSAEFEVVAADGKVVGTATGKPSATAPALGAALEIPVEGEAPTPFVVRAVIADRSSGAPFVTTSNRALVLDPSKAPRVPPLSAVTTVTAAGVRAGDPIRGVVTIQVRGGSAEEQKRFRDALQARPPVVAVEWSGGRTDSAADPNAFGLGEKVSDGSFVMSVAFRPGQPAGAYDLSVTEGAAAGTRYPAARARVRCIGGADLQLLVVAHRQSRVVLFDSAQKVARRPALDGEPLTLELVRGAAVDPRQFVGLGQGLRAPRERRRG